MAQLVLRNILAGSGNVLVGGDNSGNVNKITIGSGLTLTSGVLSSSGGGSSLILTTIGTSGAATYSSITGVLNIPIYSAATGAVSSVFGRTGTVIAASGDYNTDLVTEGSTNLYYSNDRARSAFSATTPLSYNSTTGVFTISQATTSTNGYLSSTNWNTFNNKQAALNGTGFVKASGTSITYDNSIYLTTSAAASTYLTISNAASTYLPLSGGTLTGSLNGTNAIFNGFGINSTPTSLGTSVSYSRFLNTGADFYIGVESSTAGGFFTGSSAYASVFYSGNAQEFIIGGVRRLQIASTGAATFSSSVTQSGYLDILGGSLSSTNGLHQWFNTSTNQAWIQAFQSGVDWRQINYNGAVHNFLINDVSTLYVSNSRNVLIGTTTDAGYKLDVSGTGRFSSSVTASSLIKSGGTSNQFLKADGSTDSSAYITLTSLSAVNPLFYNTTFGTFSINQANTSTSGYVSSTDWNTFNNKQPAGAYLTANQNIFFNPSGDVTGTSTGSTTLNPILTLATITQSTGSSFVKITLDTKGRVTGNSSVSSGDITSVLGYTPYNSSNPSGYITSAGSSAYATTSGSINGFNNPTTAGTANTIAYRDSFGYLYAIAFYEYSDVRFKNVLETNPIIDVNGIDVIKFNRKDNASIRYGYSAQQVKEFVPEAVNGDNELVVNYSDIHTLKIAALERRILELENILK